MNLKADTEYIFKTGNTISYDGTIPLKQMQEIVRCKDCKYWEVRTSNETAGKCMCCDKSTGYESCFFSFSDDFCSYGERKGGDES